MARRVFHSFHFARDHWRVQQIRNMGVIEGQTVLSPNEWEAVKRGGEAAIQRWINEQMSGRSCVVVLTGNATAGRKWINYEIEKAWNDKKGLVGVYIHRLKDADGYQDPQGGNPFSGFTVGGTDLASIVPAHNPPYSASEAVYGYIKDNLEDWIEEGIAVRRRYG